MQGGGPDAWMLALKLPHCLDVIPAKAGMPGFARNPCLFVVFVPKDGLPRNARTGVPPDPPLRGTLDADGEDSA